MKIESIEIEGTGNSNSECKKCVKGSSPENSFECDFCKANFYYEESKELCVPCTNISYSENNSIGVESCKIKLPCAEADYSEYDEDTCDMSTNSKIIKYNWNEPFICNNNTGVNLPEDKNVTCSNCQRDEYILVNKDNQGTCETCPKAKYYNESDYSSIDKCKVCSDGYTPNFLSIEHFKKKSLNYLFSNISGWKLYNNKLGLSIKENNNLLNFAARIEQNITITENVGSIQYNFTFIEDLSLFNYVFTISFTNSNSNEVELYKFTSRDNITIYDKSLPRGNYRIILEIKQLEANTANIGTSQPMIILNFIKIYNSTLGGGYTCLKCEENTIRDLETNTCLKCSAGKEINNIRNACDNCLEGFFNDANFPKCLKCPDFTFSNNNRESCILMDVLHNKKSSNRFIINELFDTQQKVLCESDNDLCYGKFFGPIKNEQELFFFSLKEKSSINLTDFSYTQNDIIDNGFIFSLKNKNPSLTNENDISFNNVKILNNMGSQIEYVRLFSNRQGYVIKYSNGNKCEEDNSTNYSSILIVNCHKENDKIYSFDLPYFLRKLNNNCTNVFEWKTRYGCSSCLKNEVFKVTLPCRNGKRNAYYSENNNCNINSPNKKQGENSTFDDSKFAEDEKDLKFYFESANNRILDIVDDQTSTLINLTTQNFDSYPYVDNIKETEACVVYEDFDNIILYILIAVPCFYLLIAFSLICYCVKLKRISNQYSRLVDEREGNSTEHNTSVRKPDQQLELEIHFDE